jgi:hypothetical protein
MLMNGLANWPNGNNESKLTSDIYVPDACEREPQKSPPRGWTDPSLEHSLVGWVANVRFGS